MSTVELHEVTFRWPYPASDVIVTGSFDGWSRTIHLPRTPSGFFQGNVKVPWGEKIAYKYIVDGRWTTTDNQPTELDPIGNINNVYTAPTRPYQPKVEPKPAANAPEPQPTPAEKPQTVGQTAGILGTAKETAIVIAEALAPGTTDLAEPTPVQTPAAATSTPEKAEQKQEPKSVEKTAGEPAPEPASITLPEPSVPPPAKEVEPEAVLPPIVKSSDVLPIVAVPLVPLAHEEPPMNGDSKPVETAVADNAPSTHTPIKPNGKGVQATEVALPPTTPTEVPLPSTPPTTNGKVKPSGPNSVTSTPSASANTTPHKERRSPFPTFGRKHRHSSSSHSVSEHGDISPQPSSPGKDSNSSLKGSARKKRMSIFHKIRDVFHHDEHGHRKEGSK